MVICIMQIGKIKIVTLKYILSYSKIVPCTCSKLAIRSDITYVIIYVILYVNESHVFIALLTGYNKSVYYKINKMRCTNFLLFCFSSPLHICTIIIYSRLSLSRSRRDPLKHFEITLLRHIKFAELRKILIEQPNLQMDM